MKQKWLLFPACEKANEEMVELILKSGGNPSRGNNYGVTPLQEAVGKNVSMCKQLVEAGAKIWTKNTYGIEALFTAAQGGCTEVLKFLIKQGEFHQDSGGLY